MYVSIVEYHILVIKYYVLTIESIYDKFDYVILCGGLFNKMAFKYSKLWVLLAKNEMSKTQFREELNLGTGTLAKLGKNEYVAMEVLDKICNRFQCDICDIMEHVKG